MEYYSDKEVGPKPRKEEKISPTAWGGIVAYILATRAGMYVTLKKAA